MALMRDPTEVDPDIITEQDTVVSNVSAFGTDLTI